MIGSRSSRGASIDYRGLDATAREGISDEDYATSMATLETMARNLGWDESQGMPGRGVGGWHGHGHHRGHRRGHGYCGEHGGELGYRYEL